MRIFESSTLLLFRATPLVLLLSAAALLSSCAPDSGSPEYKVEIIRTSHGIAHITAADLPSLGYGEGYGQAQDHLCSIADQVVRARSERARYFGVGDENRHLNSDLGLLALDLYERARADLGVLSEERQRWLQAFAAGYNRYLKETGADNVRGWCRGEPWVKEIDAVDISAYHRLIVITGGRLVDMIATAEPPIEGRPSAARVEMPTWDMASNAWAIGSDLSASGSGMLVANPHYPWVGSNRFWEKHLTIPGKLDVYGVGLIGIPSVAIGFNRAVAWSHTVSAGQRLTLYKLDLVDGDPTRYHYDDEERQMEARELSVEVLQEDGTLKSEQHTVWNSHYGPMLNFPGFDWNDSYAITFRDANEDNDEMRAQWLDMNAAHSLADFKEAHAKNSGMPWVNTISTSAEGIAWYTDSSSTPNLSDEALEVWEAQRESHPLVKAAWGMGTVLLNGSDSRFEWIDEPGARDPGVVPFADMPQIATRDYAFNANDSFWMSNSDALLAGDYSPLHGLQNHPVSTRTRMNDTTLDDESTDGPRGEDGKFSLRELEAAALNNKSMSAHLLRSELVARCKKTGSITVEGRNVDLTRACSVLEGWNETYEINSRGAVLFREWITQYDPADLRDKGQLFAVGFDPADPVGTPRGLAPGPLALENLGRAVGVLEGAGHQLDVALGDLQYAARGGKRIPIHGGIGGYEGIQNAIGSGPNGTTLEPLDLGARVDGSRYLRESGYPVTGGTSFIMALEYTEDGPVAEAFLTYSQSGDPDSPLFYDQTELFSKKQWRKILFEREDVLADLEERIEIEG